VARRRKEEETEEDPEARREARAHYLLAAVRQFPDPVLRTPANDVALFDDALVSLVERMKLVMERGEGVGLAAPQVGVLQRLLLHQAEEGDPAALVNPRIVESSEERNVEEEGCLSIGAATIVVEIERPMRITVEARSLDGEPLRFDAEGFTARVIQHEIDHLDGVLTIDRTTPEQRREALAKLRPHPMLRPV
jgi:peptide deformylase